MSPWLFSNRCTLPSQTITEKCSHEMTEYVPCLPHAAYGHLPSTCGLPDYCNRHALGTLEQAARLAAGIFFYLWLTLVPQYLTMDINSSAYKYGAHRVVTGMPCSKHSAISFTCNHPAKRLAYNRLESVYANLPIRNTLPVRWINEITPSSRLVVEVFRGSRKSLCSCNRHEGVFAPRCPLY